jgi:predicted AlkP superfamily pyrophosphatase or phosphodiesterase
MSRFIKRFFSCLWLFVLTLCLLGVSCPAQELSPVITVDHAPNATQQLSKPYVILVSLDGFRYDYAKRYAARNLLALASRGVSAPEEMIPSYPSLTFPNHYTLVTGLYPEHHGIVANGFYDPARKAVYRLGDPQAVTDGSWYGGTPLWVLAEQQGMRSACFFWPGSEAEIQGTRPTYYLKYDDHFPNDKRVQQVLAWLRLPPAQRPHFITLYFSDTDHAGHQFGPESPQVAAAVQEVDKQIGSLVAGLKKLHLPVDLIVLADHGMAKVQGDWINLSQYGFDPSSLEKIVGLSFYSKSESDAQKVFDALHGKSDNFAVYRRAQMPAYLHYDSNPRIGDPVIVAAGPYAVRIGGNPAKTDEKPEAGNHGYDPKRVPEMKASFFAAGPDIRSGVALSPFENVNVYPFVAKILGLDISHLTTGPIDGNLSALQSALKKSH